MEKNQFHKEFLSKEIILKLIKEIHQKDYGTKISLIRNYANTIKHTFDEDVFAIRLNNEIGFVYWEAEEYQKSISHFNIVANLLKPADYPFLYFHVLALLIRCNRLIGDYSASLLWTEKAFREISFAETSFIKLNLLKEYADVITDSNQNFNKDYESIIQYVIDDLGFPQKLENPIETINKMKEMNLFWNAKLSKIGMKNNIDKQVQIKAFEDFLQTCEIKGYKEYANNKIKKLKESN